MWQVLYPNSYVQPQSQTRANFWYKQGEIMDVDSRELIEVPLDQFSNNTVRSA
jgi:hypothetical protein